MSPAESARLSSTDPTVVRAWLAAPYHTKPLTALEQFELDLRLGRLTTSSTAAARSSTPSRQQEGGAAADEAYDTTDRRLVTSRTVELLRNVVGGTRWTNAAELLVLIRGIGRELHSVGGFREPAIGNVVRRVMAVVREEATCSSDDATMETKQDDTRLSLQSMLYVQTPHVKSSHKHLRTDSRSESFTETLPDETDFPPAFYTKSNRELKPAVMEAIEEIMNELRDLHKNIDEQATSHIHAGEIILTYGQSKTVEMFLKAAARKMEFQVVVCEGAPHFGGHDMAKSLAAAGIDTIIINDSATFAVMARVNKVLLPAHAVMANGGLITSSGSNMVALAAKANEVPVVCITGMFKLCPTYPHEGQDTLNDLVSPSSVVEYSEMEDGKVELVNPVHDYIAPEYISLYVTNHGAFQPSYIYKLLAEHYHADDWLSFES